MIKRIGFSKLAGLSLAVAFILASCNAAAPAATAAGSATLTSPAPSATATVAASATASSTPSPTIPAPDTPTPQLTPQANPGMNAYCRRGPGTGYYAVTFLKVGTFYDIIGQNGLGTWWLVKVTPTVSCWMGDPTSVMQGPLWRVPIVMVAPLPGTPSGLAVTFNCDLVLHTLVVSLTWKGTNNLTGFRLYRNGRSVAVIAPNIWSYQDNQAPLKTDLEYELQAFNDLGVSDRIKITVPSCN